MAENIHNWDIQTLDQMKTEIDNIIGILTENENLLESQGFELLGDWQGLAGRKIMLVTAANAGEISGLIKGYTSLRDELNDIITKCYEPCENEIKAKATKLLTCC